MRLKLRMFRISGSLAVLMTLMSACNKPASTANDHRRLSSTDTPRVQAGLELTRSGKVEEAKSFAEKYLASAEGSSLGGERCKMRLIAAFSYARLRENSKGENELRAFASECKTYPLSGGWDMEAQRIRRLLDGERPEVVYRLKGKVKSSNG